MNDETSSQLKRQADWQSRQKNLPWPEKVRQAEASRDAASKLAKAQTVPSWDGAAEAV
jgi:hypothetical protein